MPPDRAIAVPTSKQKAKSKAKSIARKPAKEAEGVKNDEQDTDQ